jgi:acetolactate synthase-1/2/3 large subunit
VFAQAFRIAESNRPGAAFVSLPADVMVSRTEAAIMAPVSPCTMGSAAAESIERAGILINEAKNPVVLLGSLASQPQNTQAFRELLKKTKLAVANTFQAAGVISRDLLSCFAGRVGLFHNQPADRIIDRADLVVTIGYDPVEYDPVLWNHKRDRKIVHIDALPADADADYRPTEELVGDIAWTLKQLSLLLSPRTVTGHEEMMRKNEEERSQLSAASAAHFAKGDGSGRTGRYWRASGLQRQRSPHGGSASGHHRVSQ